MRKLLTMFLLGSQVAIAQSGTEKQALKYNLNDDGSHYLQATLLNQTWLRYNQSNPGTMADGVARDNTLDIGLRRTRIQMFGQITDKVFIYMQFGQNNFNAQYATGANRKVAAFFHDALCEYKVSQGNQLKIGGGLTIANGLSRFSQPSVGTILTMDVPVFAQATVDQTDEFARKLSLYARGQVGHFDYRFAYSDPFPITSSGASLPAINADATFAQKGRHPQLQGYVAYQFFEHEPHTTPYMAGTYLGSKKVFNIAAGAIYQQDAMWKLGAAGDTAYQNMMLIAAESYLDMPLNKEKKTAISAYAGYFHTNYGTNYLRYNGAMNPANGTSLTAANSISGKGPLYGNTLPMFGTGNVVYAQAGYLLPTGWLPRGAQLLPYVSATIAKFDKLDGLGTQTYDAGVNYLLNGHKAKFTLDLQNRPTYGVSAGKIVAGDRKNCVTLQYQIYF